MFLEKQMLHLFSANCIGYQSVCGSSSRCWFWTLMPCLTFNAQDSRILGGGRNIGMAPLFLISALCPIFYFFLCFFIIVEFLILIYYCIVNIHFFSFFHFLFFVIIPSAEWLSGQMVRAWHKSMIMPGIRQQDEPKKML